MEPSDIFERQQKLQQRQQQQQQLYQQQQQQQQQNNVMAPPLPAVSSNNNLMYPNFYNAGNSSIGGFNDQYNNSTSQTANNDTNGNPTSSPR